jgi:acyl-CoA synthetase (AMP-forming)/AMP-acid ligase II
MPFAPVLPPGLDALVDERAGSGRPVVIEGATGTSAAGADVAAAAGRWREAGLEGPVGLALSDPVVMATHFVAALAAGVLVAPLDPAAPDSDLAARVAQLGLRTLITDPGRAAPGGLETIHAGRTTFRPAGGRRARGALLPAEPATAAALLASSGTTGPPKVVPLTTDALLGTASAVASDLGLEPDDRGYSPLPLFHINGLVVGVLSALVAGSSIVVDRRFSRRSFWATVADQQVTWLNLVPAIIGLVGPPPAPTGVRLARSAAAPLASAVRQRFESVTAIPVLETYGMTEAASQITANRPGAARPGSVGRPSGLELRVDGDRVRIRGERVIRSYWSFEGGRWTSRAATDPDGWLDTGDRGRLDPDGYLFLDGRDGDVINRGGEKVWPREVEEVLMADPRVAAAVVVGRPHPLAGEEPVAFVLPAPGADPLDRLASDLTARCERSLSRYKRPASVVVAQSLPTGPTGKVRRAAVRAIAGAPAPCP